MNDRDALQVIIDLAAAHAQRGGAPYAAGLLDAQGRWIVRGVNEVRGSGLTTRHAELCVIESAQRELGKEALAGATLFASTEPCPMCAGAIHWAGIPRLVFGVSIATLVAAQGAGGRQIDLSCRDILARSPRTPEIIGPLLEASALAAHRAPRPSP